MMVHDDAVGTPLRASHHTLSGCKHGERPRNSLLARAGAAHKAGITEIGACADDLGHWAPHELRKLIRQHGVQVTEIEWLDLAEPDPATEQTLFEMGSVFGARQLNAGVCSPDVYPEGFLVQRLRYVAGKAAEHGMTVAFEPVAFGSVRSVAQVQRIIDQAGVPNAGTLLDVYHLARDCWDSVAAVNPDLVAGIQINGVRRTDNPPTWPYGLLQESQCNRLMPDAGDFPVFDWLVHLARSGVRARLSVEVLSDDQRALNVFDAAERVAKTSGDLAAVWESMVS